VASPFQEPVETSTLLSGPNNLARLSLAFDDASGAHIQALESVYDVLDVGSSIGVQPLPDAVQYLLPVLDGSASAHPSVHQHGAV
jgi:hypothetical protein